MARCSSWMTARFVEGGSSKAVDVCKRRATGPCFIVFNRDRECETVTTEHDLTWLDTVRPSQRRISQAGGRRFNSGRAHHLNVLFVLSTRAHEEQRRQNHVTGRCLAVGPAGRWIREDEHAIVSPCWSGARRCPFVIGHGAHPDPGEMLGRTPPVFVPAALNVPVHRALFVNVKSSLNLRAAEFRQARAHGFVAVRPTNGRQSVPAIHAGRANGGSPVTATSQGHLL
jgi:hypothetical protein